MQSDCKHSCLNHKNSAGPVQGKKMQKERVTLALTTNATGTDKLKPVVIGTAKRPRAFGRTWQPSELVDYYNSSNAWMTTPVRMLSKLLKISASAMQSTLALSCLTLQVFTDWIKVTNRRMADSNKRILLLMDNASSHAIPASDSTELRGLKCISLSNIMIVFLPRNTTSVIQPLDAGIIAAFKQRYRAELLRWYVQQFDSDPTRDLSKQLPDIRQAITWSAQVWQDISEQTIRNCWHKVQILLPNLVS